MSRSVIKLAVVGGGPKAAALAAKADALARTSGSRFAITVFEPLEIGANWAGNEGYTDGRQPLCTPSERDIGFPYRSGASADLFLMEHYSWPRYCVENRTYSRWVDKGCQPASHSVFSAYLKWVVGKSTAEVVRAAVVRATVQRGMWKLTVKQGKSTTTWDEGFDGLVITGPGPPRRVPGIVKHRDVFDGRSFWLNRESIKARLRPGTPETQIVVIGGGGAAAAILAWLCRNGFGDNETQLVADQAALFSRGESVFENSIFTNDNLWKKMSIENRNAFFERLNRGVVWNSVMSELEKYEQLSLVEGRAVDVRAGKRKELKVLVHHGNATRSLLPCSMVVDASGFDTWWFTSMFSGVAGARRWGSESRAALQKNMRDTLDFSWKLPPVHVPNLSSAVGPGFGSLMCLGDMADRVLSRYLR